MASLGKKKILRISTIPLSLKTFCKDLILEIQDDYEVLAVSSAGSELDDLANAGIATERVDMKRNISLADDIKSLIALTRLFRRYKPDMVHSITPKAGLLAMTAAWLARVPVRVHSITGLIFPTSTGIKRRILMATDKATCAFATHILPEGKGVRDDLINSGITKKHLRVLGYGNVRGVDLSYYKKDEAIQGEANRLRREFGIPDNHFVFVFVGRIAGDKGINELIEAFMRLRTQRSDVHLLLAGKAESDDPISESSAMLIDTHSAIHSSKLWIDDVRHWYAAADALVFPSYREGFPNVVLEAGAMHLPSIVTDINGSREIIEHGVNGLIVPAKDSERLYEAMRQMIDNIDLAEMGRKAHMRIAERYEAGFVRQCLKDFYKEIL